MVVGTLLLLINIYELIVLARVLMSWFPNLDPYNPVVRFLYDVTEPVLQPIRRFIYQQFPGVGPFDFSPLALLIILMVLQRVIIAIF